LDTTHSKQEGELAIKALAEKIARDAVRSDPSILSTLVLDDKGSPLAVVRSSNLPAEDYLSERVLEKFGMVVTVFWAAAEGPEQAIGRREFIIGAYREQMILITSLNEYKMLLALRLNRSASVEHVYMKLANLLGLSHNSISSF
jgi:hypothetical protein